jgi:hypothetical protein
MQLNEDGQLLRDFIEKVGTEYFVDCVKGARNRHEVIRMLGFIPSNSTNHVVEALLKKLSLTKDHFCHAWNEREAAGVFVNHGDGQRHTNGKILKRCLIREGRVYKCAGVGCTCTGEWLGKPLTLEVDHISGDRSDDRQENLRFLCPNCHSQTRSYKTPFAKRYNRKGFDKRNIDHVELEL